MQSKLDNYGVEYPNIDPNPKIENLMRAAAEMRDIDFHYKMIDIFMSLRDHHTTYQLPGPHKCVENYKAVAFDIVGLGVGEKILVSGFYDNRVLNLSPAAKAIRIGDELLSISDIPISNFVKGSDYSRGGANKAGSLRAALQALSHLSGKYNKLPRVNIEKYQFKRAGGSVYEVRLPWISVIDTECWSVSKNLMNSLPPNPFVLPEHIEFRDTRNNTEMMALDDAKFLALHTFNSNIGFQAAGPLIRWYICPFNSNFLGVIAIKSFEVNEQESIDTINRIRELLVNELKDTDALLLDIRSNSGGNGLLADMMPQLFGINVQTGLYRANTSPMNEGIFLEASEMNWVDNFRNSRAGDTFTPLIKSTTNKQANRIGQAYLKTVGVFTNGKCYSACEIFAANMKDNDIATIFGEDYTTGGGGAINVDYTFLSDQLPYYFPPLPYSEQVPLVAQNLGVARKQFVRINGNLVEDTGVISDYIIRPELMDLKQSSKYSSQYGRIAIILFQQAIVGRKDKLKFQIHPKEYNSLSVIGQDFTIRIQTTGFKTILIFDESGILIKSAKSNNFLALYNTEFVLTKTDQGRELNRYNIKGYNFEDKLIFSTWKLVRYVPSSIDYLQIADSININLAISLRYVGTYNYIPESKARWVDSHDGATINSFGDEGESSISYFFKIKNNRMHVSVKGSYHFDSSRGYLKVAYTQDKIIYNLFNSNNQASYNQGSSNFDQVYQVLEGNVELVFLFKCDGSDRCGAVINSISVS